jgi:probable HAF family extracellular repeat protein
MSRSCALVLCVVFSFLAAGVASAQYYVTDLGTLGGAVSEAYGVNATGQVIGYSANSGGTNRAFLYGNGTMSDIGQYYADHPDSLAALNPAWPGKVGGGINDNGRAAWTNKGPLTKAYGFLYNGGTIVTPISTYSGVGGNPTFTNDISFVTGITNNGLASGYYPQGTSPSIYSHPLLINTNNGTMVDLGHRGPADGDTKAYALSGSGTVVGGGWLNGIDLVPADRSFVWDSTNGIRALLPGDPVSDAYGINDSNQAVGVYVLNGNFQGTSHAFLCPVGGTALTDLGVLRTDDYSAAYAINNLGQVVGVSANDWGTRANPRAFLWTSAAGMKDLNTLISPAAQANWTLEAAQAISSNGYIAGYGINGSGATHAFLLKPALPGDANLDGTVDIGDLSKVLASYDKSGLQWADGDFDGNGTVDITDLSKILANYDKTATASAAGITAVPEPATLLLLASGLIALAVRTRRIR